MWICLAGVVSSIDQLTKHMVMQSITIYERVQIMPFFDIVLTFNRGAAFSFLSDASGWQRGFFIIISTLAVIILVVWLFRLKKEDVLVATALSFILGGALGNLYDRVTSGEVVDFLLFYYDRYYFPAFNLADSAITLGAGLLILDMLIQYFKSPKKMDNNDNG